jgi:hypothetical protein
VPKGNQVIHQILKSIPGTKAEKISVSLPEYFYVNNPGPASGP